MGERGSQKGEVGPQKREIDPVGWILAEYGTKRSHGDLIQTIFHDFCPKSGIFYVNKTQYACPGQACPGQACPGQACPGQAWPVQARPVQVRPVQAWLVQAWPQCLNLPLA